MKLLTEGLIIREQNIGENDKLITVLTKSNGVVKGFVRGAKNIKNSKCSATQLLCYSRMSLYLSRDTYIVDDVQSIEMFIKLRNNVKMMSLAQYFCELFAKLCPAEQPAQEHLSLVLNSLYLLSNSLKEPLLIKAATELRLLCLCGYMPDLVMCKGCGCYESKDMAFNTKSGTIICADCKKHLKDTKTVEVPLSVITAMRHIIYSDNKKMFSFTLSEENLKLLNKLCESYLINVTETNFKTLMFYKVICND